MLHHKRGTQECWHIMLYCMKNQFVFLGQSCCFSPPEPLVLQPLSLKESFISELCRCSGNHCQLQNLTLHLLLIRPLWLCLCNFFFSQQVSAQSCITVSYTLQCLFNSSNGIPSVPPEILFLFLLEDHCAVRRNQNMSIA